MTLYCSYSRHIKPSYRFVCGCRHRCGRPPSPLHSAHEFRQGLGSRLPPTEHQRNPLLDRDSPAQGAAAAGWGSPHDAHRRPHSLRLRHCSHGSQMTDTADLCDRGRRTNARSPALTDVNITEIYSTSQINGQLLPLFHRHSLCWFLIYLKSIIFFFVSPVSFFSSFNLIKWAMSYTQC